MKKFLSVLLVLILSLSFVACGQKQETKQESSIKKEDKKETIPQKEVAVFTDILDNLSQKDYFYLDNTGDTIKILDKNAFKEYTGKSLAITTKAIEEKKIDAKNIKIYSYYRNVNGDKLHKNYVVVYDANKVPTDVYEVIMTISDKDQPALKEVKQLDKKMIDDKFKTVFATDLKAIK